jgi:hypothetical protein
MPNTVPYQFSADQLSATQLSANNTAPPQLSATSTQRRFN